MTDAGGSTAVKPEEAGPQEQRADGAVAERTARRSETLVGLTTGCAVGVVVLVLALLAFVRSRLDGALASAGTDWVDSVLSMGFLLIALQYVSILVVHEHWLAQTEAGSDSRSVGRLVLALLRVVVTSLVLAAVWWSWPGERWTPASLHRDVAWDRGSAILLTFELITLLVIAAQAWRIVKELAPLTSEPTAKSPSSSAMRTESDRLTVGASGGGIRAAAFVLGGHQAVQGGAPDWAPRRRSPTSSP